MDPESGGPGPEDIKDKSSKINEFGDIVDSNAPKTEVKPPVFSPVAEEAAEAADNDPPLPEGMTTKNALEQLKDKLNQAKDFDPRKDNK